MPSPVLSVRVSDDTKAALAQQAAEHGVSVPALANELLANPSVALALQTLRDATSPEQIDDTAALASHPRLAQVDGDDLLRIAQGLQALAARWPR